MIDRLLDAAIRFRWAVLFITLAVAAYGPPLKRCARRAA